MISPTSAANKVKEVTGYEYVVRVKDYSKEMYVVEVQPKKDQLPHGEQNLFSVNKDNGEVAEFYLKPGSTLEKFLHARKVPF